MSSVVLLSDCDARVLWHKRLKVESLYRSLWHANHMRSLTLAFVSSWFIVLWLTKLFNFSQIFVCHRGHGSSAAFLAIGRARVTILCKNPIDASVIPLLVSKLFCNLSRPTSPSFFNETRNNNCQIVFFGENHFQSNQQTRHLHNLIFNSPYVINCHSMTSLVMLLKFISK